MITGDGLDNENHLNIFLVDLQDAEAGYSAATLKMQLGLIWDAEIMDRYVDTDRLKKSLPSIIDVIADKVGSQFPAVHTVHNVSLS